MSRLPPLWATAPLGDVAVEYEQQAPEGDKEFWYIDIGSIDRTTKRIVTPRNLLGTDAPSRARKVVRYGDVLVSLTRPNLNAVALVPQELDGQIASTGFEVLRTPELDSRWIYYIVRSREFVERMSELVRGALYPAIRGSDVRGFSARFAPVQQQTRIADVLDDLLAKVDSCRTHLRKADTLIARFREAVLAAACSGELTVDWREAEGVGQNWPTKKLGLLAKEFRYGSSAKSAETGSIPVLRMGNIRRGRLEWSDLVYSSDPEEIAKYRLQRGDVLFNRTNTPELVGKTAVYNGERDAIYAGYLIRVRCRSDLLPDYLSYCLNSPAGRQFSRSVKSDSVGQSNINARKLAEFPVPVPSLNEQKEIVRRVKEIWRLADDLELRCERTKTHLERFVPEVITACLAGKLVRLVPSDEPAAALLERIRAQRAERVDGSTEIRPRTKRAPRAPREGATLTKTRHDPDVQGKDYLAALLRGVGTPQSVDALFRRADLPVADFYKQLSWEISQGYIDDNPATLKATNAS